MASHKNHKGNKFSVMMDESMPKKPMMKPMMKESEMMMVSKGRKVSKKKRKAKKRKK